MAFLCSNMADSEPNSLLELGPKSTVWLADIGIQTHWELEEMGIVPAYCLLKAQGYPVSLNLLYALYGALYKISGNMVSPEVKKQLQAEVEDFRFG